MDPEGCPAFGVHRRLLSGLLSFVENIGCTVQQGTLPGGDHGRVHPRNLAASSDMVSSFFKAASATLALNSGLYRLRLLLIVRYFLFLG